MCLITLHLSVAPCGFYAVENMNFKNVLVESLHFVLRGSYFTGYSGCFLVLSGAEVYSPPPCPAAWLTGSAPASPLAGTRLPGGVHFSAAGWRVTQCRQLVRCPAHLLLPLSQRSQPCSVCKTPVLLFCPVL